MVPEWNKNSVPMGRPPKDVLPGKSGRPPAAAKMPITPVVAQAKAGKLPILPPPRFVPPAVQWKAPLAPAQNKIPFASAPGPQPKAFLQQKPGWRGDLFPSRLPVLPPPRFVPPTAQLKTQSAPGQNKIPSAGALRPQSNVFLPNKPSSLAKPRIFPPPAIQLSKKMKGEKLSLGEFFKTTPLPKAWGGGVKAGAAVVAAAPAVAPAPAPPQKPTRFNKGCDQPDPGWTNQNITALRQEGNKPARFWTANLQDRGASQDGATQYWSFDASWSKNGNLFNDNGTWTQHGGTFIDGTLQLHFHPHAKPSENYLHIKKSDGADPQAGEFDNKHWLVPAIGLTAKALTPDGK